ncbi:membrane-spanning 4-domains subfamily A member 15 [Hemicordylus capensis]|uniref:membrane-spanning 4-domains subfamily A member 15 n=1 Tax=Hemicordylus capensis TaxID=884348 RepID=UPI0023036B73|nr:membrane-spanning 4-domains subfamily A member 15 [Hemicordylus capensis]
MSTTVTECGNVRIITQMIKQGDPQGSEAAIVPGATTIISQPMSAQIKSVKNTLPKAFGAVQIVLGTIQISFGTALAIAQKDLQSLTVKSGVYFWIGILLLVSGSLLVEMEKRQHMLLAKISFYINLLVSVAALVAIILHGIEINQEVKKGDLCAKYPSHESSYFHCSNLGQTLAYGLNSVFIILSVLEISIAVATLVIVSKSRKQQLYSQMAS